MGFNNVSSNFKFIVMSMADEVLGIKDNNQVEFQEAIIGDLNGNADTATQLKNTRTINGVNFNGTANINISHIRALDKRNSYKPSDMTNGYFSPIFASMGALDGTANDSKWVDIIGLSGWTNSGGSGVNALVFTKTGTEPAIYHYKGSFNATTWTTKKQIAYIDSNIASATKLQNARNFKVTDNSATNSGAAVSFNGSADVTLKLPSNLKVGTLTSDSLTEGGHKVPYSNDNSVLNVQGMSSSNFSSKQSSLPNGSLVAVW